MRVRITQTVAAALAAGALASAQSAQAQTGTAAATDTRWRAWIGCWEPVTPDNVIATADTKAMRVCVVPGGSRSSVDVVNVVNGRVAERTRVDATGAQKQIGREGCTGVESAQWSADTLRVYLKAELTCDGVQRTTSGILAFGANGEWLDVQGVTTGKNSGVHVARYRPVNDLTGIPAEVTSALPSAQLALMTARGAAAGPLEATDVADAVKHVQAPVVEAWLLERGQGFKLSASQLVALQSAGVPGSTTDLMVALSFPKTFAINRGAREAELLRPNAQQGNAVAGRTIPVTAYGYSPFGWGPYSSYYSWYGYDYGRYGAYSPYGGYGGGYGYGYSGPIVIIQRGDQQSSATTNPRVVRGGGYTEGRTTSSPSSSQGSYSGSSSSSSSSGSSSSAPASSSAGSSSSSGGGERTARPKTP